MTVTVTATVDTANTPQRVVLNISATTETATTITRLNPDGSTVNVRTFDGNPTPISAGTALLYDYEMPYGQVATYSSVESPTTFSSPVTVDPGQAWLIHPGVPALSQPVQFRPGSFTQRKRAITQGVFWPMGRSTPIVVSDGSRKSVQSSMTVLVRTANDLRAIEALTSDGSSLLLNIPASSGWNFSTCYVAISDIEESPVIDKLFEQWVDVTMPFTVVDMPVGGSQSQRTYVDLLSYATYSQLKAAYPSYTSLLAGP